MKFNLTKCHTLTLTRRTKQSERNFTLNGGKQLSKVESDKDLGVIVDSILQYREHIAKKTKVANSIVAIIRKSFVNLTSEILTTLYKALARTHLEYWICELEFANLIWHPRLIKHQKILENVQRKATRLVSGMKNLSYYESLKELNLSSLEYRRKRGTMIEMYSICYGFYDRNSTAGLFERNDRDSRGNACKVVVRKANLEMRKNFFTIRAPLD